MEALRIQRRLKPVSRGVRPFVVSVQINLLDKYKQHDFLGCPFLNSLVKFNAPVKNLLECPLLDLMLAAQERLLQLPEPEVLM